MQLEGKIALVTGASRGIGKAIAVALAAAGADVAVNYAGNRAAAEAVAAEIEAMGRKVLLLQGDVAQLEVCTEMIDAVIKEFGRIDILVNNAGISYIGLLTDMQIEDWNHIVATNLTSVFSTCRCCVPSMVLQKSGKIISISSVWGNVGASCEVAYSACKGGINSFTRALGKELAPSNIQVNAIACGVIDTDMNRCFSDEERAALVEEIPAGRMGAPEEVAQLALHIAEDCNYLNGQIITLDGGWI